MYKKMIFCILSFLLLYTNNYSQDKREIWIGLLRADGILVPYLIYDNNNWKNQPSNPDYWAYESFPHQWFLWPIDIKNANINYDNYPEKFRTGENVQISWTADLPYGGNLWGMVTNYSFNKVYDQGVSPFPSFGLASNMDLNITMFEEMYGNTLDVIWNYAASFISNAFYDAENIKFSKLPRECLPTVEERARTPLFLRIYKSSIQDKEIFKYEVSKIYKTLPNRKNCFLSSLSNGWIIKQGKDYKFLNKGMDLIQSGESQTRPLAVIKQNGEIFVITEFIPHEGNNYLEVYKLQGSSLIKVFK